MVHTPPRPATTSKQPAAFTFTIKGNNLTPTPMKAATKRAHAETPLQINTGKRTKVSLHVQPGSESSSPNMSPLSTLDEEQSPVGPGTRGTRGTRPPVFTTRPETPLHKRVDLSHIEVPNSYNALMMYIDQQDTGLPTELLEKMKALVKALGESSAHNRNVPLSIAKKFLDILLTSDPNSNQFDEDNNNSQWGHALYSTNFTPATENWQTIGNADFALHLLSAGLRVSLVARALCFHLNVPAPSSWLADDYLGRLVDKITHAWVESGAPLPLDASVSTDPPDDSITRTKPQSEDQGTGRIKQTEVNWEIRAHGARR
ncbi:hypothetical protein HGRIS_013866 [Hohenbuehelia grisea]|uniref:Uncharacterized protein n=1 Tax=Hohenbuehelia grisea TaxID=104357 RepID=A0ABR3IX21_9AGAR